MRKTAIAMMMATVLSGSALTMAAAPAMASCNENYVCFYKGTGLTGKQYDAPANDYTEGEYYLLSTWYPANTILGSVWNRWKNRVYVQWARNSNVNKYCYPARTGTGSPDTSHVQLVYFGHNGHTKC